MNRIWTVARREVRALFDHPTGYVLLVVFLGINNFLYFRQAYLAGFATLRPMLDLLPWVFLFFVPAVTMRALAEDTRSGLLEVVLAQPLSEMELVIGKYLGGMLFLATALALTLAIPIGLSLGANLPWGTIGAQYVGALLLAAGLAGVGVWASSLTRSQITAFIVAVGVMFMLVLVGMDPLLVGLPPGLAAIAARLGVLSHFQNIGRGVIDLRDAIYFLSLAGSFLVLAYGSLMSRKLAPAGSALKRLRLGVTLLVAIVLLTNLLGGSIGGRLDFSPGKAYTLSRTTKNIAKGLDDLVTIKLFASKELPAEVALLKRDVDDMLRDLRSAGGGKIRVVELDPGEDAAARQDAQALGIERVQFNVYGKSELQVKEGYFGLAVLHGSGVEPIPFIRQTDDLEYRLASAIRTLTRTKKPVIGLLDLSYGEGPGRTFSGLAEQLGKSYEVRPMAITDSTQPTAEMNTVALIGEPDSLPAPVIERLGKFLDRGGSALVLGAGMRVSNRSTIAQPHGSAWNPLLQRFGVSIQSNLAYDLMASEVVPIPTDFGRVYQSYPFFIRAKSTGKSVVNHDINDVVLTWASSIDTAGAGAAHMAVTPLLITSPGAGLETGETNIDPRRNFARDALAQRVLAVQVTPLAGKDSAQDRRSRLVVVGDADFVSDIYVRSAPENLVFGLNALDWLGQDDAMISIRSKDRRPPQMGFKSDTTKDGVKYANVILVPALVALFGLVRLVRRRSRTREPYRPVGAAPAPSAGAA